VCVEERRERAKNWIWCKYWGCARWNGCWGSRPRIVGREVEGKEEDYYSFSYIIINTLLFSKRTDTDGSHCCCLLIRMTFLTGKFRRTFLKNEKNLIEIHRSIPMTCMIGAAKNRWIPVSVYRVTTSGLPKFARVSTANENRRPRSVFVLVRQNNWGKGLWSLENIITSRFWPPFVHETKTRFVEAQVLDASPRQYASQFHLVCEGVLCEIRHRRVRDHPPYSPDLAPLWLIYFPEVKSELKGTRFDSAETAKATATEVLNKLTEADHSQHCFEQWKIRMERCRDRQGEYVEGDKLSNIIGDRQNVL